MGRTTQTTARRNPGRPPNPVRAEPVDRPRTTQVGLRESEWTMVAMCFPSTPRGTAVSIIIRQWLAAHAAQKPEAKCDC